MRRYCKSMKINSFHPVKDREFYRNKGILSNVSLGRRLADAMEKFADRTALVQGDNMVSYKQLLELTDRAAAWLLNHDILPGERILVELPNSIALTVVILGAIRSAIVPVLALAGQKEKDISALCRLSEPRLFIAADRWNGIDYSGVISLVKNTCPQTGVVCLTADQDLGPDYSPILADEPRREYPEPDSLQTALMLLSGGTTGTPKLIPRTHAGYQYNADRMAEITGTDENSVFLATIPEAHNFSLSCPGLFGILSRGGKFVIPRNASFDECFDLIEKHRVTIVPLVPGLAKIWAEAASWYGADLSSLKVMQVGGARLEVHDAKLILDTFGPVLQQVYGTAEGLINATRLDDPQEVILSTQGRPISEYDEYRIVDHSGCCVGPGEAGELITRGIYTIDGYFRAPEKNREAFTQDGWYRMGDLVRETDDGNFVVVGRIKDQINRAGEKIAPSELEEPMACYPDVQAAVAVAVPDETLGERICLFIVSENFDSTCDEVRRYLRDQGLPEWKLPDDCVVIRSLPLTAVGKIDRKALLGMADREPEPAEE